MPEFTGRQSGDIPAVGSVKILIVKLSSLGDVIHTLPAISDICAQVEDVHIDWVVEEAFTDIPALHPGVTNVLPVALRRWRHNPMAPIARKEIRTFLTGLRHQTYDLVLDAQGLIKSALVASLSHGKTVGMDWGSSREGPASLFYDRSITIARGQHAVDRTRQLAALTLDYSLRGAADFGLTVSQPRIPAIMLLHGTTWPSKHWPEEQWKALAAIIRSAGYRLVIPAGNPVERARASRIAIDETELLPPSSLGELVEKMAECSGVVSVDTGLGHLAGALGLPTVAIYGSTDPILTGVRGAYAKTLVSDHLPCIPCKKRHCKFSQDDCKIYPPCLAETTPETTWKALQSQIRLISGSLN